MAEEPEQLNSGESSEAPEEVEESQEPTDTEFGESEDDTVPYNRFKEAQTERTEFKNRAEKLEQELNELRKQSGSKDDSFIGDQTTTDTDREIDFDQIVKTAKSWNEVADEFANYSLKKQQQIKQAKEKAAREELEKEVKQLHDLGLVENEEQETKVFEFAVEKSKELGRDVDLVTAANWMKDMGAATEEGEENALRKGEASKQQSSKKSSGDLEGGEKESYDRFKSATIGDLVEEAKPAQ